MPRNACFCARRARRLNLRTNASSADEHQLLCVLAMKPKHYEGGCLCGFIRFRVSGEPGKPHTCSCEICRKHSGSLTLTWVEFPAHSVEWLGPGGKPSTWRSSSYSSRAFCSSCGCTIGAIDDEPTVAIATGALDKPHLLEFAPRYHSYISRRPRWWHLQSDHESSDKA
ncbi:GFA family protein [Roseateles sp.]|uniref:GFA family protein n=1 Tax=Roseateles sp. TaxID=1971397 RepID=UPI003BA7B48E